MTALIIGNNIVSLTPENTYQVFEFTANTPLNIQSLGNYDTTCVVRDLNDNFIAAFSIGDGNNFNFNTPDDLTYGSYLLYFSIYPNVSEPIQYTVVAEVLSEYDYVFNFSAKVNIYEQIKTEFNSVVNIYEQIKTEFEARIGCITITHFSAPIKYIERLVFNYSAKVNIYEQIKTEFSAQINAESTIITEFKAVVNIISDNETMLIDIHKPEIPLNGTYLNE